MLDYWAGALEAAVALLRMTGVVRAGEQFAGVNSPPLFRDGAAKGWGTRNADSSTRAISEGRGFSHADNLPSWIWL